MNSLQFALLLMLLHLLWWLVAGALAMGVSYLLLLTVAAWWAPKRTALPDSGPSQRFVFLVPAHNEEQLLPRLLANLQLLDYPPDLYRVHVVADNCTDQTAMLSRHAGAMTYERFDKVQTGKGYALQWLLQQLAETQEAFDAGVVLDADSLVSANFLRIMDAQLQQGARVVQAYYAVLDPDRTWVISLRAMALAVLHYLRPQGRMVLGGSAGLKGNGMVFHHSILRQHQWSASVTEDIEYHMALVLAGERVVFAPDAMVWATMPPSLHKAWTQNVRWEQGRLQMALRYLPRLLRVACQPVKGGQQRSRFLWFDAAMEHLIPPFSLLIGLSLCTLFTAFFFASTLRLSIALFITIGQVVYLWAGLSLTRASRKMYLNLLYVPVFMGWKIWLYMRVMLRFERQGWVRTARENVNDN